MQISKPFHNRYILNCVDNCTYGRYAEVYSGCKRWGVRAIYAFLSVTGLVGRGKGVVKGNIVQYGKRRIAIVVIGSASYICAPAIAIITNATKVVRTSKLFYTTIGYVAEALEEASHVPFLPIDVLLFGQPVPANIEKRFSSWSNMTDLIN